MQQFSHFRPAPTIAENYAFRRMAQHRASLTSLGWVGLGQESPIVGTAVQGASIATSVLALIPATGPLAPFAAIGVGLFALFSQVFGLGSGCGQTCVLATKVVNQVEPYLQRNLSAWQSGGHTQTEQKTALQVFDTAWQDVLNGCGQASLADAGRRCISERQAGGCAAWQCNGPYKSKQGDLCCGLDWFALYRDPIANDPNVVADPPFDQTPAGQNLIALIKEVTGTGGSTTSTTSTSTGGTAPASTMSFNLTSPGVLIPAGLILLALIL